MEYKKTIFIAASVMVTIASTSTVFAAPTCNSLTCSNPNTMQSCLQTYVYTAQSGDISNCVFVNSDVALQVCQSGGGQTGNQAANCAKVLCMFGSPSK